MFNNFYFLSITFKPFSLGQKKSQQKGPIYYAITKVRSKKESLTVISAVQFPFLITPGPQESGPGEYS